MASFFNSHKYSKIATSEAEADYDFKGSYQSSYTVAPYGTFANRSARSDSSGSYSSVASSDSYSDSHYEKLAPTAEELTMCSYDDKPLPSTPKKQRRVTFQLEKDLPSL
jgi:hypothetical protein